MNIYFDIESEPYCEDFIRGLYDFDPSTVKVGNTKDPEKIKAKQEQAEQEFYAEKIDKAALNPDTSEILAINYAFSDSDEIIIKTRNPASEEQEKELIENFWHRFDGMKGNDYMVGWNILEFDLPYLLKRSWIHGIRVPAMAYNGRINSSYFKDAMVYAGCGKWKELIGLTKFAKSLGVACPREHNIKGKDLWRYLEDPESEDQAIDYMKSDLIELKKVCERMGL